VIELLNEAIDEDYVVRTEAEITPLLDGFELVSPGLVPVEEWRNEGAPPVIGEGIPVPIYGAVGHKP
jgi:hypothetical protein